ncbi:hypothetical protein ACK34M_01170 [Aeromonas veronii]
MKRKSAKQEARLRERQAKKAARVEQARERCEREKAQRPRPVYTPEQEEAIRAHLERKAAAERARATAGWVPTLTNGDEWRFGSYETKY